MSAAFPPPPAFHLPAQSAISRAASLPSLVGGEDTRPSSKTRLSTIAEDKFSRIHTVTGVVINAKGLYNADAWGKSDPYCVVKGIRANNHLVDMYVTCAHENTLSPVWNERFTYECPKSWGVVDLVGLKFLVYDTDDSGYSVSFSGSDDFLGGADIDLSQARANVAMNHTLELGGANVKRPAKASKPRLMVELMVTRCREDKPLPNDVMLLHNLSMHTVITQVDVLVLRAKNLRNADWVGKSDPQCVVRALFIDGEVRELGRSHVVEDCLSPDWNYHVKAEYGTDQEPMMLFFDVFDVDEPDEEQDCMETGEHLGSAWLALVDCGSSTRKRDLELLPSSQLLESRLNQKGKPANQRRPAQWTRSFDGAFETFKVTDAKQVARAAAAALTTASAAKAAAAGSEIASSGRNFFFGLRERVSRRTVAKKKPKVVVEISVTKNRSSMPHYELIHDPLDIEEEDDIIEALKAPSWNLSTFPIPKGLKLPETGQSKVERGTLRGKDRIVFVSGAVHGASALINADSGGKSDPFCIVEALSETGMRSFIHRTRVIHDRLSPIWHEAFFFVAPEDFALQRLLVGVYDDDSADSALSFVTGGKEDEFLGRCIVDLSYLRNGERLYEDMSLVGLKRSAVNQGRQSKSDSGFRRSATISLEIRVERRVLPYFENKPMTPEEMPGQRKYALSRSPEPGRMFVDPSQEAVIMENSAPAEVLGKREEREKKPHRRPQPSSGFISNWLRPLTTGSSWRAGADEWGVGAPPSPSSPSKARPATSSQLQELMPLEEEPIEAFEDRFAVKLNSVPQARTESLPALHTPILQQGMRQFAQKVDGPLRPGTSPTFHAAGDARLLRTFRRKPPVIALAKVARES
mmetsp:Transcript_76050/g.163253  ORF Transcript_76050/g.163253 Transcript_76050/m.163253 type:complete len:863 (+) Transcript_76050:42-2630(+)